MSFNNSISRSGLDVSLHHSTYVQLYYLRVGASETDDDDVIPNGTAEVSYQNKAFSADKSSVQSANGDGPVVETSSLPPLKGQMGGANQGNSNLSAKNGTYTGENMRVLHGLSCMKYFAFNKER